MEMAGIQQHQETLGITKLQQAESGVPLIASKETESRLMEQSSHRGPMLGEQPENGTGIVKRAAKRATKVPGHIQATPGVTITTTIRTPGPREPMGWVTTRTTDRSRTMEEDLIQTTSCRALGSIPQTCHSLLGVIPPPRRTHMAKLRTGRGKRNMVDLLSVLIYEQNEVVSRILLYMKGANLTCSTLLGI